MPTVYFAPILRRHVSCPEQTVSARTVREALDEVFRDNPRLKGYVLDDQDRLRKYVNVFVDGTMIADRVALSDPVGPSAEVYVLQSLAGG